MHTPLSGLRQDSKAPGERGVHLGPGIVGQSTGIMPATMSR